MRKIFSLLCLSLLLSGLVSASYSPAAGILESDDSGNIGVGTASPREAFEINGTLQLGEGKIRFNDSSASYEFYNGSVWGDLSASGIVPAGAVVAFSSVSCPDGWVAADGSGGTPDLRGIFIRGSGTSGILNMSNGTAFSASYGEYMNDSLQEHRHYLMNSGGTQYTGWGLVQVTAGSGYGLPNTGSSGTNYRVGDLITAGSDTGTPRVGSETAPASYALLYCVKTSDDSSNTTGAIGTLNDNVTFVQNVSHNFGVGTTNPLGKLDVSGDIYTNGNKTVSGDAPVTNAIRITGEYMFTEDNELNYSSSFVDAGSGTVTFSELPSDTVQIFVAIRYSDTGINPGITFRRTSTSSNVFVIRSQFADAGNNDIRGTYWLPTSGNTIYYSSAVIDTTNEFLIFGYKTGE